MILGMTGLVLTRILLGGAFAAGAAYLTEDMKEKKVTETEGGEVGEMLILNEWETLFHQLGIIKADKGDRVEEVEREDKAYYKQIDLKVTTGVKVEDIRKHIDSIRTKLNAPRLEVSGVGDTITLKEVKSDVEPKYFKLEHTPSNLIKVGFDDEGEAVYWDTTKDNSVIVAGSTGAGKTRLMHTIICNILNNKQNEVFLIDLKDLVEFKRYEGIEGVRRLEGEEDRAKQLINGLLMERKWRMETIRDAGCADYEEYIEKYPETDMTRIFLIADEVADFSSTENQEINKNMFRKKQVGEFNVIQDLRQITAKGRAAAIHVLLGSQRMTVDNIDPTTKSNCTGIVGMKMQNKHNSNLIIDSDGLELLDKGEAICRFSGVEQHIRSYYFDNATRDRVIDELRGNVK